MPQQKAPLEIVAQLEAEVRALRLELAGAELAFSMVGRAFASTAPETANALIRALETVQPPYFDTPGVQALLDGLQNTRPAQPSCPRPQSLRLVVDNR
ncbi:hypothetical protein [Gemmobacter sp.]|uniref:hypothetical protein n=1 Tax=Gemmobacter sp. TaxID=1898957 RepID=UPI002AFEA142|nr:hypothetical protein [Gemmobacter sp.]